MGSCLKIINYDQEKAGKQAFMIKNGKDLLEKLIASRLGKYNPIRCFSVEELKKATNNFDNQKLITIGVGYHLYRGSLQDYQICIMKFLESEFCRQSEYRRHGWVYNVVFASQMCHKNILKLIGCCLETQYPILVFENVKNGTFQDHISRSFQPHFEPFLLIQRVKIAMEIANAVAYLHIGFSRPIVFRDINSSHILFDENYVPKLFNFSLSRIIPEGETQINEGLVAGTSIHLAPEYVLAGDFNEKMDVYNFGALLLELLTGKSTSNLAHHENWEIYSLRDPLKNYIENNRFNELANPAFVRDGPCPGKEEHLLAFIELAFKCLSESATDRPNMIDVAKQLRQIYQSLR